MAFDKLRRPSLCNQHIGSSGPLIGLIGRRDPSPRRDDEHSMDNFSSGADAAALRISLWCASQHQWEALTIDVRTAFLNAKMVQGEVEPLIAAKPPALQVEKMYLRRDVYYHPEKAAYGLRRSPRFWGITRDETISTFHIQGGRNVNFRFEALQSIRAKPVEAPQRC